MRRKPLMPPRQKHGANRSAATAMVVGAGLVCAAGSSWGNALSAGEIADVPDIALTSAAPQEPDGSAPVTEASHKMAGWNPVDEDNLNTMRGGFDEGACPAVVSAMRSRITEAVAGVAAGQHEMAIEASGRPPGTDPADGQAHLQQADGAAGDQSLPGLRSSATESLPEATHTSQDHADVPGAAATTVSMAPPARAERLQAMLGGSNAVAAKPAPAADPVGKALPLASRDTGGAAAKSPGRGKLAAWKPVAEERLDELRGGFDVGGLQASFGIERAVFINGNLVVSTTLTIPDIAKITSAQASQLVAALAPITNVGATASAALVQPGQVGTAANASGSNGSAGAASTSPAASSTTGGALPVAVIPVANGTVITNGQQLVVQNGLNNTIAPGVQATSPATVIQNTLNGQAIQSLTTINVGVNTLQAYRAAVAATVMNDTLLNAAARR